MESIASIILAAGQGKRMKSSIPKILHSVAGKPMITYSLKITKSLDIRNRIIIVGKYAEEIKKVVDNIDTGVTYIYQKEQMGTAHAVQQAEYQLNEFSGIVLVLYADVPLLRKSTIRKLIDTHIKNKSSCTLLTAMLENPEGYGRIIRDEKEKVVGIVEHRDLKKHQEVIKEINTGIYCFNARELFANLKLVDNNNKQKEYYLTDVIRILLNKNHLVKTVRVEDIEEIYGINTRMDLSRISRILYNRNAINHMSKGITVIDTSNTYIESNVKIGQDTIIYPFTMITDGTRIGKKCHIGPYSHIINSNIGKETRVYSSVVEKSKIGNKTNIGPYAHIRPDSNIGNEVRIGNYVEVKKTSINNGSKVGHLTYLGDAILGKKVNIGAGTITCNYDGEKKNTTIIKDHVFIGSNNSLVAPVVIKENSYTAAGSTITEDLPAGSLGIARSRQKNIVDWVRIKKKKEKK